VIDHFMYGVPDLDAGLEWASRTFGVRATPGGSHPGLGTCNALLSLGDTYLEILAPDPRQSLAGTLGGRLAALDTGGLVTWAARGDLLFIRDALKAQGIDAAGPVPTSRRTPDGGLLEWELLFPRRHAFGPLLPFFIDWKACAHPSTTSPVAGALAGFTLTSPQADALGRVLAQVTSGVRIEEGNTGLRVEIDGRRGAVALTTTPATLAIGGFA